MLKRVRPLSYLQDFCKMGVIPIVHNQCACSCHFELDIDRLRCAMLRITPVGMTTFPLVISSPFDYAQSLP